MKLADTPVGRRELTRDHVAFYRAVMEGIEPKAAWVRYCQLDGDFTEPLGNATLTWVRQELIAEALAAGQPAIIGLLRRDPRRIAGSGTPTLEEFSSRFQDAGDFSEAEMLELWKQEFGSGSKGEQRRARLVERLREALTALENAPRRSPKAEDSVHRWLAPSVARRLAEAQLTTLGQALASLRARRSDRWQEVPGVGEVWAQRLQGWLESSGIRLPAPPAAELERQLVPLELMRPEEGAPPSALLGGPLPSPALAPSPALVPRDNQLGARDDRHAVELWLAARGTNPNTHRAYRKVAERLLLWCRYERRVQLADMNVADCIHYRTWLNSLGKLDAQAWAAAGWRIPAEQWIAKVRAPRRDSPEWRPFEGPLSAAAAAQELSIVGALFTFLLKAGYVTRQPWELLGRPSRSDVGTRLVDDREQFVERSMTREQWNFVLSGVEEADDDHSDLRPRLHAILWLGFACGLRAAEMLSLTLGSLVPRTAGWRLRVLGKGSKVRTIPLPSPARDAVLNYLAAIGLDLEAVTEAAFAGSQAPLLRGQRGRRAELREPPTEPLAYSTLYRTLKAHFRSRADDLAASDTVSAAKLRAASTHWLRHTCGTLALNSGVPLNAVQRTLGHADLRTTSGYVTAEADFAQSAMEKFATDSGPADGAKRRA